MTQYLKLDAARDMDVAELRARFDAALARMDECMREACACYVALLDRGEDVPLVCPAFRHAEAVAKGELSARAAMRHATNRSLIAALTGQPLELQDRLVAGEKVKIAVLSNLGRIHSLEVCIDEMSEGQLRRAFGSDGIRDWQVQGELLIKGQSDAPKAGSGKPVIKVDRETRDIIINRLRVSPDDLMPAFASLGLQVKPFTRGQIKPVRTV